ncbi:MAG: LPD38 domain-containing protein [Candidatus Binatia bacterium]
MAPDVAEAPASDFSTLDSIAKTYMGGGLDAIKEKEVGEYEKEGGGFISSLERGGRRFLQGMQDISAKGAGNNLSLIEERLKHLDPESHAYKVQSMEAAKLRGISENAPAKIMEQQAQIEAIPQHPTVTRMAQSANEADGMLPAVGAAVGEFADSPDKLGVLRDLIGEQGANIASSILLTRGAGGVTAPAALAERAIIQKGGQVAATAAGGGAGSYLNTYGPNLAEQLKQGKSIDEARRLAARQSAIQAIVDMGTSAIVPIKIGGKETINLPAQTAIQMLGGGGGEYLAQKSIGLDPSQGDIVIEGLLEAVGLPGDLIAAATVKPKTDGAPPPAAPPPDAPGPMTPDQAKKVIDEALKPVKEQQAVAPEAPPSTEQARDVISEIARNKRKKMAEALAAPEGRPEPQFDLRPPAPVESVAEPASKPDDNDDDGDDGDDGDGGGGILNEAPPAEVVAPAAAIAPEPEQQQAEPPVKKFTSAIDAVEDAALRGEKFENINQARKLVADTVDTKAVKGGTVEAKDVDEQIEVGFTKAARKIAQSKEDEPEGIYDKLVDLYSRQPNLSTRTSTSKERQAYSTPAPIAYLASRLAGVKESDTVYEPTAGHGMLVLEANEQNIIANELDEGRVGRLKQVIPGARVENKNALDFDPGTQVDVVIANPPFGKLKDADGQSQVFKGGDLNTSEIDHAVVMRSLQNLKDDGRAVFIIGGKRGDDATRSQKYNSKSDRAFWKRLYGNYNVTDHFSIDGKLYSRQGAGFPLDVIVVKGRGKSSKGLPAVSLPRQYDSFESLKELVNGKQVENLEPGQRTDAGGGADDREGDQRLQPLEDTVSGAPAEVDRGLRGSVSGDRRELSRDGEPELVASESAEGKSGDGALGEQRSSEDGDSGGNEDRQIPIADDDSKGDAGRDGELDAGRRTGDRSNEGGGPDGSVKKTVDSETKIDIDESGNAVIEGDSNDASAAAVKGLQESGVANKDVAESIEPLNEPSAKTETKGERRETAAETEERIQAESAAYRAEQKKRNDEFFGKRQKQREEWVRKSREDFYKQFGKNWQDVLKDVKTPTKASGVAVADSDGRYAVDGDGFVKSENGSPIAFENQKMTAAWILKVGHKTSPDQVFEISNHPTLKNTFTVIERAESIKNRKDSQAAQDEGKPEPEKKAAKPKKENTEKETKFQVMMDYANVTRAQEVGTLIPVNQRDALVSAMESISAEHGSVDEFVTERLGYKNADEMAEYFSAEQVTALAMAIDNIESGAGFIIGDQTGVGKGRVVAGIMRYAKHSGRTPIFVTEKPGLFADMYRDTSDIGLKEFNAFVTNKMRGSDMLTLDDGRAIQSTTKPRHDAAILKMAETGNLPAGYDALFTTYSQMQTVKGKVPTRVNAVEALAKSSILILDESHNAGGQKVAFKQKDPETGAEIRTRASIVRDIVDLSSGTFYSSATYAKNSDVMDLYRRTDMAKAVDKLGDLASALQNGGVPLQQIVSSMLVERGQYRRAERSYDGVEMKLTTIQTDIKAADGATDLLRHVYEFDLQMQGIIEGIKEELKNEAKALGLDTSKGESGINSSNFTSVMHNLVGQMMLSLNAREAAKKAVESWKSGNRVVIALSNTFGSMLEEYVSDNKLQRGDALEGYDFGQVYRRYLRKTREYTIAGDKKNGEDKKRVYIEDYELPTHILDKFREIEKVIENHDFGDLPVSPLDAMLQVMREAGMNPDEITGRSSTIDYSAGKFGKLAVRKPGNAEKQRVIGGFNNGNIDALIINSSGSTGISLHASEKFKNQNPRHMLVVQPDPNIDTFMQMLGRIHRTGQVKLPKYDIVVSNLPAAKRLAANLMRKMASLNANTTANRDSAVSVDNVVDFMNVYGDRITADILSDDPDLAARLDLASAYEDDMAMDGLANKVTGRLSILPIKEQEEIYAQIENAYLQEIERLNAMGENSLEAKTLELDAYPTGVRSILREGDDSGNPFTAPAYLEEYDVKRLGKPYTPDEVKKLISEETGDNIDAYMSAHKSEIEARANERGVIMHEKIAQRMADIDKIESDSSLDEKKMRNAIGAAEKDIARHKSEVADINQTLSAVRSFVNSSRVGDVVSVVDGSTGERYVGIVIAHEYKNNKPGIPLSKARIKIAVADATREITIPYSKIVTRGKREARYVLRNENYHISQNSIYEKMETGQSQSREKRYIVTGNIFAGFAKIPKGQITFFKRRDGSTASGVLMSRTFKAEQELAKLAEVFNEPAQIEEFMKRVIGLNRAAIVRSQDGNADLVGTPRGEFYITAKNKGGAHFYLNKAMRSKFGDFVTSRGKPTWRRDLNSIADIREAAAIFQEELGAKFEAVIDQHIAREIKGKKTDPAAAAGDEKFSAREASPSGATYEPTLDFRGNLDEIKSRISDIVQEINPSAKLKIVNELFGEGERLVQSGAESSDRRAVSGSYSAAKNLVTVALNGGNPEGAAFHEAWHSIENLLTEGEKRILQRAFPGADKVTHDEQAAYAFQEWAAKRDAGGQEDSIRQIFVKVRRFLRQVGNLLRGYGYTGVEQIFEQARSGEIGGRSYLQDTVDAAKSKTPEREAVDAADDVRYSISDSKVAERHRHILNMDFIDYSNSNRNFLHTLRDLKEQSMARVALVLESAITNDLAILKDMEKSMNSGNLMDATISFYKRAVMTRSNQQDIAMMFGHKDIHGKWVGGQFKFNDDGFPELDTTKKSLLEILDSVLSRGPDMRELWEKWAYAKRADRLIKEGREANLSQDEIDEILKLADDYPFFEEVHKEWSAFNRNMLDFAEAGGILDPKARAVFENDDYVPFYRVIEDDSFVDRMMNKAGLAGQRSKIRKLRGDKKMQTEPIMESMMKNVAHLYDASVKNIAMANIAESLTETGVFDKMGPEFSKQIIPAEEAAKGLRALGLEVDRMTPDQKAGWLKLWGLRQPEGKDVISYVVNGKPVFLRVLDPLMLRAVTNLGAQKVDWLMKAFTLPTRIYSRAVTFAPTFRIRNFLRDTWNTMIVGDVDQAKHPIEALGQITKILKNDKEYIKFMAGGGGFGGYHVHPKNYGRMLGRQTKTDKNILVDTPAKMLDVWEQTGQASEQANRYAYYKQLLAAGVTEAEAKYQARDLLDFHMRGGNPFVRFLTGVVPFLNPRIQGLYKLGRAFASSPKEKQAAMGGMIMKRMTAKAIFWMALSTAYALAMSDDDDYDDIPDWKKDLYMHIPLGGGHYFMIPKPFELGFLLMTVPERVTRAMIGNDDTKTFMDSLKHGLSGTLSIDPYPHIFKPVVEDVANKSFFFDSPIVPMGKEDLEPELQRKSTTHRGAIAISELMPNFAPEWARSPARLEHYMRGYGSTFGEMVMVAADKMFSDIIGAPPPVEERFDSWPVVRGVYSEEPASSTRWLSRFYDLRDEVTRVHRSVNEYSKNGNIEKAQRLMEKDGHLLSAKKSVDMLYKSIKGVTDQMDAVRESKILSPSEKRSRMDDLTRERNRISKHTKDVLEYTETVRKGAAAKESGEASQSKEVVPTIGGGTPLSVIKKEDPEMYPLMSSTGPVNKRNYELYLKVMKEMEK